MRKAWIIAAVLGLAVAYGLYWHGAAWLLQRNLTVWADQWRAEGYQIDYATSAVHGFPLTLRMDLGRLEIQAPPGERTWRWQPVSASLELQAEPWRPLAFQVALQGMHRLDLIAGAEHRPIDVYVNEGKADVGLSLAGRLDEIDIDAKAVEISDGGNMLRLKGTNGRVTLPAVESPDHTLASAGFALSFDEVLLPAPPNLPIGDRLQQVAIEGRVMGALPVGRITDSLSRWRDDGGTVELARLAADWGPLAVAGNGTLALDDALQPLFAASTAVRGYDQAIDAAVAGGYLAPGQAASAKIVLGAMAQPADGGPTVKVPLTIQDRVLSVGPLRLLQLPRIEWW
jgi:aryl carrier-like protein